MLGSVGLPPLIRDMWRRPQACCEQVPYGVLVFAPSYSLLDRVVARWRQTDMWARLARVKTPVRCRCRGFISINPPGWPGHANHAAYRSSSRGRASRRTSSKSWHTITRFGAPPLPRWLWMANRASGAGQGHRGVRGGPAAAARDHRRGVFRRRARESQRGPGPYRWLVHGEERWHPHPHSCPAGSAALVDHRTLRTTTPGRLSRLASPSPT